MNLSPLRSTLSRLSSPLSRQTRTGDTAILPYAQQAREKDQKEQKRFQPLKMVLDLLQRGQYLTANIADEVEESFRTGRPLGESTVEVLKAAFQGITGQRKGDWETLLFGGKIEGTSDQAGEREGWIPGEWGDEPLLRWKNAKEGATGLAEGILRPRKWIGAAANIALDPTTYIGNPLNFGAKKLATEAAKATAKKYADDVLRLTIGTMGPDDFAKLGLDFGKKVGKNIDNVVNVISKSSSGKKFLEKTYNDAFEKALRTSEPDLLKGLAPRVEEAWKRTSKNPGIAQVLKSIEGGGYAKAGERASMKFFGKEIGKSVRPVGPGVQAWDAVKARLENTTGGKAMKDAWWSVMNNGPVGAIKRAVGIRNPYEQLMHVTKRGITDIGIHTTSEMQTKQYFQALGSVSEETRKKALDARLYAQQVSRGTGEITDLNNVLSVDQFLMDPNFRAMFKITDDEAIQISRMWQGIDQVSRDVEAKIVELAQRTGQPIDDYFRINHFPNHVGSGGMAGGAIKKGGVQEATSAGGHLKKAEMSTLEHVDDAVRMWKSIMGDKLESAWKESGSAGNLDDFIREWIKEKNLADITLDPAEAYKLLAIDQSKVMARLELIDKFRQFGIHKSDVVKTYPDLARNMETFGQGALTQYGLYPVDIKGLEDYLFDKDVAKALQNAGTMLGGDATTQEFAKAFGWMTQWWKGTVLATPGYHVRNWISNNVTGFLKHGPAWLNPAKYAPSSYVGAMYAAHPEKYMDLITQEMKVSPAWVQKELNRQWGDFSLKEIIDYYRQSGLLTSRTQAALEIGQKFKGNLAEKMSAKNFAPFKISQKIGDVNENMAKVQEVLMDLEQMVGKGGDAALPIAERLAQNKQYLEYADQEAKKWFIDYGDLTDFEKKTLGKVIPFYSWMRHNLSNQLSGLALYPEMYSIIPKIRGAATDDEDFEYELMPSYMENQGYYPIGQTEPGNYVMRWANIPLEDVNKIPVLFEEGNIFKPRFSGREVLDDIMASAHPLIKTAVEMTTGYDVFHKREIRPFERASPVFQYLNNAPQVIKFLDGAMRIAGFEDGIKIKPSRDGKEVQINGKVQRFLETNLPALRTLDLILGGTEVVSESLNDKVEGWVERTFGKKDYYKGLEELFQITSPLAGVKFKEFNEDQARIIKEAQLYAEAQKLKARDTTPTRAQETRAAKARVARETRNRLNCIHYNLI